MKIDHTAYSRGIFFVKKVNKLTTYSRDFKLKAVVMYLDGYYGGYRLIAREMSISDENIVNINCNLLILFGIYFSFHFIITKELYIQAYGYTINTFALLVKTIVVVGIYKLIHKLENDQDK
jgi:hypothetical protein